MKNPIELFLKKEELPKSYKEHYERLKQLTNSIHQYVTTSFTPSGDTLFINISELDKKLSTHEINHKQAYFNLLNTCYEKTKKNSVCIFLNTDREYVTTNCGLVRDVILTKELPKAARKGDANMSFLTPDGLFQYKDNFFDYLNGMLQYTNELSKTAYRIFTKDELKDMGFQDYLTRAETADLNANISIKDELLHNELMYTLDKVSALSNSNRKYHSAQMEMISPFAEMHLQEKQRAGDSARYLNTNRSSVNFYHPHTISVSHYNTSKTPAQKGAHGLVKATLSFKEDIYYQLPWVDRMIIELIDSIDFLEKERMDSYTARIKEESDFQKDSKNLIRDILFDVYHHAKTNPSNKIRCYSIIDTFLMGNWGYDRYEFNKPYFSNAFTRDHYIEYIVDSWIKNNQNNQRDPSFYDTMLSLLKLDKMTLLDDFKYNPKENKVALANEGYTSFLWEDDEEERSYYSSYPSKKDTPFHNILVSNNSQIVEAFHKKYHDPETSSELKIQLHQFIVNLAQFEHQVRKVQIQAELFNDIHIAKSIKLNYCRKIQSEASLIQTNLMQQHDQLKAQMETLFGQEVIGVKNMKIGSIIAIVLGAAVIIIAAALAIILNPLSAIAVVPGVIGLASGCGFYAKAAKSFAVESDMVSKLLTHGQKAVQAMEQHAGMNESQVDLEDNKVALKF